MMISAQDFETMSGMLRASGVEPTTLHTPAGSFAVTKYGNDPVSFVKDFGTVGEMVAYQEDMLRKITEVFRIPSHSLFIHPVGIAPTGDIVFRVHRSRASRGWRRHVRRMKAARR